METKQYSISKEHCQKMISGVCTGCGGQLNPIETVDNAGNPTFWAGCEDCQKFCWGVDPKIFKIALKLVEKRNYQPYHAIDEPTEKSSDEEKKYYKQSQTEGTVRIVQDVFMAKELIESEQLSPTKRISRRTKGLGSPSTNNK